MSTQFKLRNPVIIKYCRHLVPYAENPIMLKRLSFAQCIPTAYTMCKECWNFHRVTCFYHDEYYKTL